MSNQLPPLEDLPIFDSAVFTAGDQALTYNQALKRFLRYPAAQGKETLAEIVVNGPSTFNSNALFDDAIISITDGGKFSNTLAQDSIILNNSDTGTTTTITSENVTSTNWDIQPDGTIFMGPNLYIRDTPVGTSTVINKTANDTSFTSQNGSTDTITFVIDGGQQIQLSNNTTTFDTNLTNILTTWDINNNTGNVSMGKSLTMRDYTNTTSASMDITNQDFSIRSATNSSTTTLHVGTKEALRLGFTNSTFNNNLTNTAANWNIANASGQGTFVNLVATGVQPASTNDSTAVPTTNWVQSRITALLAAANSWSGSQTFLAGANIPSGANLSFPGAGGTQARISPATTPQNNLQINLRPGTTPEPLYLNNPGSVFTGTAINIGTAFGYDTGASLFQNLTGTTTPVGFTFSSMTSTVANKVLGIIPYNQPVVGDSTQNLATTSWVQSVFAANPLLSSNNTWSGTNTFNNTISSNVVKTTPGGIIQIIDSGGVSLSQFQQIGIDLSMATSSGGEFKFLSQGGGVLPTANNLAGTSLLWNVSSGRGESCIVNYQDSGGGVNGGGFDFYNVSAGATSTKIAGISVAQPAANDSTTTLATTAWTQSAITAASSTPVLLGYTITAGIIYLDAQNNEFVNFGNAAPISQNIIGYNISNVVTNGTYQLSWTINGGSFTLTKSPTGVAPQNVVLVSNLAANASMANGSFWLAQISFPVGFSGIPSFIYTNVTA